MQSNPVPIQSEVKWQSSKSAVVTIVFKSLLYTFQDEQKRYMSKSGMKQVVGTITRFN